MQRLWSFLQEQRNQQVLGWIGGGLVVAVTGIWVAFAHFFPAAPPAAAAKPTTSVQADCNSAAVGGNVTGNVTITAGNTDCSQKPK